MKIDIYDFGVAHSNILGVEMQDCYGHSLGLKRGSFWEPKSQHVVI